MGYYNLILSSCILKSISQYFFQNFFLPFPFPESGNQYPTLTSMRPHVSETISICLTEPCLFHLTTAIERYCTMYT